MTGKDPLNSDNISPVTLVLERSSDSSDYQTFERFSRELRQLYLNFLKDELSSFLNCSCVVGQELILLEYFLSCIIPEWSDVRTI